MLASTVLPRDRIERSLSTHRAHLGRELGDRRQFGAGDDRRDLVRAGIEADELDRLAGAADRLDGAEDRRAARAVDRVTSGLAVRMSCAAFETLRLIAVGRQRGDDLEAVAEARLEAVDTSVAATARRRRLRGSRSCRRPSTGWP